MFALRLLWEWKVGSETLLVLTFLLSLSFLFIIIFFILHLFTHYIGLFVPLFVCICVCNNLRTLHIATLLYKSSTVMIQVSKPGNEPNYLLINLSVYLYAYLSMYLSICLSIYFPNYLSIYLFIRLSIFILCINRIYAFLLLQPQQNCIIFYDAQKEEIFSYKVILRFVDARARVNSTFHRCHEFYTERKTRLC